MWRHVVILLAASVLASAVDNSRSRSDDAANVILVVSDGLRWQEVFRGADSTILFGDVRVPGVDAETRRKYWRSTIAERRAALMPFVWGTLARDGQLLGNRDEARC